MKRIEMVSGRLTVSFALLAAALATGPVRAQQATEESQSALEEITVTAQRRAESLQTVPVAVTAFSESQLESRQVTSAIDLIRMVPNLLGQNNAGTATANTYFMRGLGSTEQIALLDPPVSTYVDDVIIPRQNTNNYSMFDVERVEVLRGPQGTTFGRNTIGGAIQFVSKRPTNDFHVDAKAGYGRFHDWYVRSRIDTGYIGGANIKASFAAQHREADGYVDNLLTGGSEDPGSLNSDSFQAAVQGDFGDVTVNYNFDYNDRRGAPGFFQLVAARPDVAAYFGQSSSLGGSAFVVDANRRQTVLQESFPDRDGVERYTARSRQWGHALTIAYEALPELTIKSITGYRDFFQDASLALTGNGPLRGRVVDFTSPTLLSVATVRPYNGNNAPQKQHQFSQELQALGSSGDFSYLGGIYYFHERASEANRQSLTIVTPLSGLAMLNPALAGVGDAIIALNPALGLTGDSLVGLNAQPVQAFGGTSESMATFGQVSWKPGALDQKLELTAGARYTADKKTIVLGGDVGHVTGRASFENVSWLASASYHFTPDILGYVRASTGYRSGGINPRVSTPIINSFAPEKATAYEIGLKSELFDRRLRVNLAGYLTNYDNLQVQQFAAGSGGATTLIVNAGKVQLKGFEAEVTATPVRGLVFDGSVGYIDTTYKQFLFRDPLTSTLVDVADIAKPVYTPKWSIRVGGEYSHETGLGLARLRVDYAHRSTIYFNALNLTTPFNDNIRSRPDENLKARLSLEDIAVGGGRMTIGLWGDNLTSQKNIAYGIDFGALGFAGAIFKRPVSYGFDVGFSF